MKLTFKECKFDRELLSHELCEHLEAEPDQFGDNVPYAYFPIEWAEYGSDGLRGNAVTDPLTIYIRMPLIFGSEEDNYERPTYKFSLTDLLEDFKEDEPFSKHVYDKFIPALEEFLSELKKASNDA